jgi:integrase
MARTKNRTWSYNAGERGANWCRAYEKCRGGIIMLEWFETPQDEQGRPQRDPETGRPLKVKVRESVGHRDRDKAEAAAKQKAAELLSGSSTARVMSLRQLLDRYVKDVTPAKKESKRKHDQRAARVFLAYFADRASVGEKERGPERHPSTLDREDWAGFVAARRAGTIKGWERPCRNNQIRLDLKFLLSVFHWASGADEGAPHFLARNPWRWERRRAQKMVMPKEKDPRRPGISEEQHERVLAHSPNWRFALVAVLCRATMHRMNSVRQLRKVDVDLEAGRVRWRGEFDKTGRELVTPLPPEAVEAIRAASPDVLSPWLIPSDTDPSRPVSRSVLNDWMQKVKERAGVDVDRLGFHAYKRSGIRTKEFRALPPKVQEQLTGTTHAMLRAVYDEVPFEELAEAMESLHKARRRA